MTESTLLGICEGGFLESQALARSGSCSRSLYAVCEKLLGPAVKNKRGRLFGEIMRAREAQLLEDEYADLVRLWRNWGDLHRSFWVRRRIMFAHGFCEFQVTEAKLAKNEGRHSLRGWGGGRTP